MDKRFWLTLLVASLLLSGICCKKRAEKGPEEAPGVETEEQEEQGKEAPAVEIEE
ncbi:hypothetical protein L6386_02140 [bacterium]|nr:hypothetical protein [bacterium]MBU4560928.1 hypothetical protein [bacterium]MCG2676709.1 hypothetical protein [bacterium]MCG2677351.1 hypothetical protein [bacterium]